MNIYFVENLVFDFWVYYIHLCMLIRSVLVGWLVECCFTHAETVGLLGTGAQDGHLDFHTVPELYAVSHSFGAAS